MKLRKNCQFRNYSSLDNINITLYVIAVLVRNVNKSGVRTNLATGGHVTFLPYIDTCTHFVPAMARNASWKCMPFLWHAASREHGVETCLRPVRALYTHFCAQFTQCANKMTAIDTQLNDLFTDTSRNVCAPPRIAPTTSCMREFVVAFFWSRL